MTRIFLIGAAVLASLLAFLLGWSAFGRMISSGSDVAAAVGAIGFVLMIAAIVAGGSVAIKKLRGLGLLLVAICAAGCTRVDPGYVGIRVNMYGQQRGVEDLPIVTGRVWYNPMTEDIYSWPVFIQRYPFTKDSDAEFSSAEDESITFNSIEGASLNADVGIALQFEAEGIPNLFVTFRQDANKIVRGYVRDRVRDAMGAEASKRKAVDILATQKEEFMAGVNARVRKELGQHGIKLESVSLLATPRVDETIAKSINAVISATQRAIEAENKVKQAEAEARQKIATAEGEKGRLIAEAQGQADATLTRAKAQAEANQLLARSLTTELIAWQTIAKWKGEVPSVAGSNAVPFIDLKGAR